MAVAHDGRRRTGAFRVQAVAQVAAHARSVRAVELILAPEVAHPRLSVGFQKGGVGHRKTAVDDADHLAAHTIRARGHCIAGQGRVGQWSGVLLHRQAELIASDDAGQVRALAHLLEKAFARACRAETQPRQQQVSLGHLQPLHVGCLQQILNAETGMEFDDDRQPPGLGGRAFAQSVAFKTIGFCPCEVGVGALDAAGQRPVRAGDLAFGQRLPGLGSAPPAHDHSFRASCHSQPRVSAWGSGIAGPPTL